MEYSPGNAGFHDRNETFSGLSDGGTQRQSFEQATVPPEPSSGQFPWSGVVPPQLEEMAMRGNGVVLALWGGIAVAAGAVLPFTSGTQASVDGSQVASGFGIGTGYRFVSCLFGLLLISLALSTRYRPVFRRRIAITSIVLSLLGFAGYFLFSLIGVVGANVNTDLGPTHVSWYPNIGALLSIGGCAACAIAAVVMLRTGTRAPSEAR